MTLKRFKGIITAALTVFVVAACFFLPDTVADIQDRQTIGNLNVKDSSSISIETNPEMTLPERLNLISISNSTSVLVKNGKKLNITTSLDRAIAELNRFSGDDAPWAADFTVDLHESLLIIDSDDPSTNMLAWRFVLTDSSGQTITLVIDDATGTIIQLIYKLNQRVVIVPEKNAGLYAEFYETAATLCRLMTGYYGVTVTLAEFELLGSLGFYKAELWESGTATPMFGIVQSDGFSINDRHSPS